MTLMSMWLVLLILSAIWYVAIHHVVSSPEHGPIRSMISVVFVLMLLVLLIFASGIAGDFSMYAEPKG